MNTAHPIHTTNSTWCVVILMGLSSTAFAQNGYWSVNNRLFDEIEASGLLNCGPDCPGCSFCQAESPYQFASFKFKSGNLVVRQPEPVQPVQPNQPFESNEGPTTSSWIGFSDIGDLPEARQEVAATVGASDAVLGTESQILNTADTADLLANSFSSTGVYRHSRNPISNDTRIRGFHFSQIRGYVNGAYLEPMRPDFDTPLGRIDSSIIRDVVVVKGPYSVRHGPGFAFIDVALHETPRECNCDWVGRTSMIYDSNGEQFNGRQTFQHGGENHGVRLSYGHRGGVDYQRGDGQSVDASYNARDWDFAYGRDLTCNSSIEFSYQRNDQTNVDLPAQYFFVDVLTSDAFSLRYRLENQRFFDRLHIDSWWNRSQLQGSTANAARSTQGNVSEIRSTGSRMMFGWGDEDWTHLSFGGDFHFIDQETDELGFTSFGLPRSVAMDTGIFADLFIPAACWCDLKVGGRVDFIQTDVIRETTAANLYGGAATFVDEQQFFLGSGFLSSEILLTDALTFTAGIGYAERAPSLTDLYARTFMSLLQRGPTQDFDGALNLGGQGLVDKEQLTQFDVGLQFDYASFNGGVHFFYGWIDDFISYNGVGGPDVVNTDAQIAGGEFFGELLLTDNMSTFGSISYVQGTDKLLNNGQPLWSIPPMEANVGLKIHPAGPSQRWGVEFISRIVNGQRRAAGYVGELQTGGFATFDIRGFARITDSISFISGVENLTNRNYREHLDSRDDFTRAFGNDGVFRPGVNYYSGIISEY